MTKLTGVGHSLKEAQVLQQKVADAIKILQVTSTHTHTHTAVQTEWPIIALF